MKTILWSLFAITLCTAACKRKQDPGPLTTMKLNEMQCADAWYADLGESDNDENKVKQWLRDKRGIRVQSLQRIKTGNGATCAACTCPSGYEMTITVPDSDVKKAEDVGFIKQ